jgi:hypothetical protein
MFWRFIGWVFDTVMITSDNPKNRDFIINHNIKYRRKK